MLILNFSHPFSTIQKETIQELANAEQLEFVTIPVQFSDNDSYSQQVREVLGKLPVDVNNLLDNAEEILVNLPSQNYIAACVLAELHGWIGLFPRVIRSARDEGTNTFVVKEIVALEDLRNDGRKRRFA